MCAFLEVFEFYRRPACAFILVFHIIHLPKKEMFLQMNGMSWRLVLSIQSEWSKGRSRLTALHKKKTKKQNNKQIKSDKYQRISFILIELKLLHTCIWHKAVVLSRLNIIIRSYAELFCLFPFLLVIKIKLFFSKIHSFSCLAARVMHAHL